MVDGGRVWTEPREGGFAVRYELDFSGLYGWCAVVGVMGVLITAGAGGLWWMAVPLLSLAVAAGNGLLAAARFEHWLHDVVYGIDAAAARPA